MHLSDLQLDDGLMRGKMPQHLDECARCRWRWEELQRDREAFGSRARPKAFADAVLARRRRRWIWWWALAPALALLVLALWPAGGERTKGDAVAVELYVKSGKLTARFDPERRYQAGDVLQVVYSSAQRLHFTAVDVEGDKVSILARDQLLPGRRAKLDRSFVLDAGGQDERVFLLFSERPLDDGEIMRAARDGRERLALPVAAQASFLVRR
jgi:hypothetical protein